MNARTKRLERLRSAEASRWRDEWSAIRAVAATVLRAHVTPAHRAIYLALADRWDPETTRRLVRAHSLATEEWADFHAAVAQTDAMPERLDVVPAALQVPPEPAGAWERLWADALRQETAAAATYLLTVLAFARALRTSRMEGM